VKELQVNVSSETHKSNSFIFDLSNKSLVLFILRSDKLSDEIFSIGFSDGFRLSIEDISQIIMILLLGSTDFNEGNHVHSR
jgi:hypothetical protein